MDYSITDIPIGRENAISRQDLTRLWHVDDRTARYRIAQFRNKMPADNYFVVSYSRGGVKGYYRTDNADEIMRYVAETCKRLSNTALPLTNAKRILARIENAKRYDGGLCE